MGWSSTTSTEGGGVGVGVELLSGFVGPSTLMSCGEIGVWGQGTLFKSTLPCDEGGLEFFGVLGVRRRGSCGLVDRWSGWVTEQGGSVVLCGAERLILGEHVLIFFLGCSDPLVEASGDDVASGSSLLDLG